MATKIPLVLDATGRVQRLQPADTLTTGSLPALNTFTDADVAFADVLPGYDASAAANRDFIVSHLLGLMPSVPGGRLTAANGVPVTSADVTGGANLYYTPWKNDRIVLWDGTRWVAVSFSQITFGLTATSGAVYDVFGYLSSGALALESLVWTSPTARATAVTIQDGRYCKDGNKTRLYLGTFYASGTNQVTDSYALRGVWNMYNRARRPLLKQETANTWTYNSATYRSANASTANRVACVCGLREEPTKVQVLATGNAGAGVAANVGICINGTAVNNATAFNEISVSNIAPSSAMLEDYGLGYTFYQWVESARAGAVTWYGDTGVGIQAQSSIFGETWA